jgi:hypothetical protein
MLEAAERAGQLLDESDMAGAETARSSGYRRGSRRRGRRCTDAEAGRGPGTRHSVRRFYVMSARELNEIDRDILEIRQYVEHQREVIRQLATGGQSQAIPKAQKALEELQVKLQGLLARRRALLQDLRRPSSIASDSDGPDRQSGGA